jgi:hypothetical protein
VTDKRLIEYRIDGLAVERSAFGQTAQTRPFGLSYRIVH